MKKISPRPLLIIGTQRSGSNLLRLMLNQCSEIDAPHPPHLMQVFSPFIKQYKTVYGEDLFNVLLQDVCAYVNVNPVPWRNFTANAEDLQRECNQPSLIEIFRSVYTLKSRDKGAQYWCCKSMANVYFIPEIEAANLNPFYIHLVRDGRDVAASFKNAVVGEKHIYFLAEQWKREQDLASKYCKQYAEGRFVQIKYEEFISDPRKTLEPVLSKLDVAWNEKILAYYLSDEAKATAASGNMWRNVVKPVDSSNRKHYSEKLTAREIEIFEFIAGEALQNLGYVIGKNSIKEFSKQEICAFKIENEKQKKLAREKYIEDVATRGNQEKVLTAIKKKLLLATDA